MTARDADDRVEKRLAEILEAEANTTQVNGAWDVLSTRLLLDPLESPTGPDPARGTRRRRRLLGGLVVGLGVAAVIAVVVAIGGRASGANPVPVNPAETSVGRHDATISTMVVYRTNAGVNNPSGSGARTSPRPLTITPERVQTDSSEIGRAALEALFDTPPAQPRNTTWLEQTSAPKIDVTSVTVSAEVIRVELNAFSSPPFAESEARVMAQTWVRTLQDTLGVRDDVLITLQGRPFWLYGSIDTSQLLARDDSVRVVRPDGFDSPRHDDVLPGRFMLIGSAAAGAGRPARVQVVDLDTGSIAYAQDVLGSTERATPVDFQPVLTLDPGRYRATVSGHGVTGAVDVTFTVVA